VILLHQVAQDIQNYHPFHPNFSYISISGDITTALNGKDWGMVQMRGGLGGKQLVNWFNAGVLFISI